MTDNNDFFCKLKVESNALDKIKNKLYSANDADWTAYLEQHILSLSLDDLIDDPKIVQLIKDIGDENRISIFKSAANTCYNWHIDSIRQSSINMLIDGFDSMCAFGNPGAGRKFSELSVIRHEPKTYYLMNVKKFHTVYNFNNQRYVLSLGISDKSFNEIKEYLKENDML